MGQSASAYDDGQHSEGVSEEEGSYYSSDDGGSEIYTDEEEGYESEGSSVSLNDDGEGGQAGQSGQQPQEVNGQISAVSASASGKERRKGDKGGNKGRGVRFAQDAHKSAEEGDSHHAEATDHQQQLQPVDLDDLSADELLGRINEVGITRDDIIAASRALRHGYLPSDQLKLLANATGTNYTASTTTPASPSRGFYVDDGHYATDVRTAMRVLASSESIRQLRFKLVPARLKEPMFWAALFGMLKYGKGWVGVAEEERLEGRAAAAAAVAVADAADKRATSSQDDDKTSSSQQQPHHNGSRVVSLNLPPTSPSEVDELRRHLRQRDAEVAQLRRALDASRSKVTTLEKEMAKMEQRCSSSSPEDAGAAQNGPSSSTTAAANPHKGTWVMDRDSQDFLALDEELKANLRSEKAKRLREVREQMKFILDADDATCSNGEWNCCGRKEYGAEGCA